eukprot:323031-Pleurochrysis_carterae.AAC.1
MATLPRARAQAESRGCVVLRLPPSGAAPVEWAPFLGSGLVLCAHDAQATRRHLHAWMTNLQLEGRCAPFAAHAHLCPNG